jgi:hypothetical protein
MSGPDFGMQNGCQTIRKPDKFVRFSNGLNKVAAKAIRKPDKKVSGSKTRQSGFRMFTVQ